MGDVAFSTKGAGFHPTVLAEDVDRVKMARATCMAKKTEIYAQADKAKKLADSRQNAELHEVASEWEECSDMIVSTNFDIQHFKAQISHRAVKGNPESVPALERILADVRVRNTTARLQIPALIDRLTLLWEVARHGRGTADCKGGA